MISMIVDIETVALKEAASYVTPVQAPSNWKDEAKIKAYIEEKEREQLAKAALDIDLCRIVAIGWASNAVERPSVRLCRTRDEERAALRQAWEDIKEAREVIGFNCIDFDLPCMIRRSQYLGIRPTLSHHDLNRYRMNKVQDLMQHLSFMGKLRFKGLDFYTQRFGIQVEDELRGGDIGALHAAGDWDGIASHCVADVAKTAQLASRLGILERWQDERRERRSR